MVKCFSLLCLLLSFRVKDRDLLLFCTCGYLAFPESFVEEAALPTMYIFGIFVKNQMAISEFICGYAYLKRTG